MSIFKRKLVEERKETITEASTACIGPECRNYLGRTCTDSVVITEICNNDQRPTNPENDVYAIKWYRCHNGPTVEIVRQDIYFSDGVDLSVISQNYRIYRVPTHFIEGYSPNN